MADKKNNILEEIHTDEKQSEGMWFEKKVTFGSAWYKKKQAKWIIAWWFAMV